ncbi:MAG: hypothetical protein ACXADO_00750 [Candidatus Thorarchaeota archaeon]
MKTRGAGSEGGLPITTVIIAIVIMVIATVVIFLALPYLEDEYGDPGPCADTCYRTSGAVVKKYIDCDHVNRMIIYYPEGPAGDLSQYHWQYMDGFEGFTSVYFKTLHDLRKATKAEYEGNNISESSWHWFDCTAEAIS